MFSYGSNSNGLWNLAYASNEKVNTDYIIIDGVTINQVKMSHHVSYNAHQLKNSQGEMLPWYMNNNASKYTANAIFQIMG
jgi:hypothetical protein